MKTPIALLTIAIVVLAIGLLGSAPVYAGQASSSPFGLLATSTSATVPHVFLVKGGRGGGGGKHSSMKSFKGNFKGYHRRWWPHGRYYYVPYYCSNWVWDGYEYTCYDDFYDDW